jgi:Domain of unknown function (DUF4440)
MNQLIFTLIICAFTLKGFCQGKTTAKDILFLESQISKAVLDNDTAKYSSFLTDDFTFSVPEGNNISKKQFLLDMKKFWHPTEINRTEQKVRINKNVAIVTGLAESKWRESNKEFVARERYTDTYMYDKRKWLLVAGQSCDEAITDKSVYENEVKNTVITLWKAWETGNKSLAEPIYSKDFIDTDFEGTRRNKEQVLNFLNPLPSNETAQILLSDWYFVIKNTTVIVNYIGEDTRTKDGKISVIKFRATDTFIKRYGHWQIIAGQQIQIKKQ